MFPFTKYIIMDYLFSIPLIQTVGQADNTKWIFAYNGHGK